MVVTKVTTSTKLVNEPSEIKDCSKLRNNRIVETQREPVKTPEVPEGVMNV